MMNLHRLKQSFKDALRGVKYVFANEQNFRVQVYLAVLVLAMIWLFNLRNAEIVVILLLITIVLILELLNSALEKFVDLLKPRLSFQIEIIKDIMAAMVFLASFSALLIGLVIFWPHFLVLFK